MGSNSQDESLQEACGLFGCVASEKWPTNLSISHIIHCGLGSVQHRGQDFAGIVTSHGNTNDYYVHRGKGLVNNAFSNDDLTKLEGNLGIGHTRYSIYGGSDILKAQPYVLHTNQGMIAVAHNGQLINIRSLRKKILDKGMGLATNSACEILTQILSEPPPEGEPNGADFPARIKRLMRMIPISYSLLIMFEDTIYAIRDPYGNRPLCIGQLLPEIQSENNQVDGYVVASESCAFVPILAKLVREVEPGEIVEIKKTGFRSIHIEKRPQNRSSAFCIFEYVYFANSGSCMEGQMVYSARYECGKQLAIEAPVDADITSGVPDSGTAAAHGFASQSGIRYMEVFHVNRYASRAFIQPNEKLRELAVSVKFGTLDDNFKGKRIILIDDSIIRGTTVRAIIKLLKNAGAEEVHLRIASSPVQHPCYMGINISSKEELIANKNSPKMLAKELGATSVVYLSNEGLIKAIRKNAYPQNGKKTGEYCTACMTGNYPTDLEW